MEHYTATIWAIIDRTWNSTASIWATLIEQGTQLVY